MVACRCDSTSEMFGKCLENIWCFVAIIWLILLSNADQVTIAPNDPNSTDDDLIKSQTSFQSHGVHKATCTVTIGDVSAKAEAEATTPLSNDGTASISLIDELKYQIIKLQKVLQSDLAEMRKQLKACACSDEMDDTSGIVTHYNDDMPPNGIFKQLPLSLKSAGSEKLLKKEMTLENFKNGDGPIKPENDSLFYMYRWKLKEFTKYLHHNSSDEVESDEFSIAGRAMKIKIYFRYLQREYLFIQLIESAFHNHNNRESNRITLDITGDVAAGRVNGAIFKKISNNNNDYNQFKYTISILKQSTTLPHTNLVSQLFHTYENGFSVPISAVIDTPYIHDDSLIIQIYFYI